jgi:hypothetical protein
MHIYIFSFLNICYNNDRKFKYFFRNNHPTIHTNLYILGYFFPFPLPNDVRIFYTAFGSQCKRGTLRSIPQQKKFLEMLRKLVYPFKNDIFFCYHQIYKSLMTKKKIRKLNILIPSMYSTHQYNIYYNFPP